MTVKEHYDNHLGFFYSWMTGDCEDKKREFTNFCKNNNIYPKESGIAVDLGAGNGIQSVALAELGFKVKAIDFNQTLLDELVSKRNELQIEAINADIKEFTKFIDKSPELIICCGDTISHLESEKDISELIKKISKVLIESGKLVLSFRDYSVELTDTKRFIPVKSDPNRILTCFLEYFEKKVRVTDLLYEKTENKWIQKISSYEKIRISKNRILKILKENGIKIISDIVLNRMTTIIGQK